MEATPFQSHSGNAGLSKDLLYSAFLLLLLHRFVFPVPENIQWIFFAVTILVAGIPHGALDHLVARQNSILQNRSFSSAGFYTTYLSRMAAYGVCWYFFPSLSLLFFILLSAFHFGETDISIAATQQQKPIRFLQTTYGLFIVLLLIFTHANEVFPILSVMNQNHSFAIASVFQPAHSFLILSVISLLMLFCLFWFHKTHQLSITWYRNFALQTVSIIVIIVFLPLPLAFAFYFGCWHSLHSLENIRRHLSNAAGKNMPFTTLLIKCIPYSIIAFSGIALLIAVVNYSGNQHVLLFLFFIGIAILTAPHLEVMTDMYKQLRKSKQ